jgi:hypothetical protein
MICNNGNPVSNSLRWRKLLYEYTCSSDKLEQTVGIIAGYEPLQQEQQL